MDIYFEKCVAFRVMDHMPYIDVCCTADAETAANVLCVEAQPERQVGGEGRRSDSGGCLAGACHPIRGAAAHSLPAAVAVVGVLPPPCLASAQTWS